MQLSNSQLLLVFSQPRRHKATVGDWILDYAEHKTAWTEKRYPRQATKKDKDKWRIEFHIINPMQPPIGSWGYSQERDDARLNTGMYLCTIVRSTDIRIPVKTIPNPLIWNWIHNCIHGREIPLMDMINELYPKAGSTPTT